MVMKQLGRGWVRWGGRLLPPQLIGLSWMTAHPYRGSGSSIPLPTSFDDGFNVSAAKRARCRSFNVRCIYPSFEPCEGHLWHSTGSNRPRFCRRPTDHDSRTSPPATSRRRASHSPYTLSRTPWPTIRITLTSGGFAVKCVKPWTGGWMEGDWMNSAGSCSGRSDN